MKTAQEKDVIDLFTELHTRQIKSQLHLDAGMMLKIKFCRKEVLLIDSHRCPHVHTKKTQKRRHAKR